MKHTVYKKLDFKPCFFLSAFKSFLMFKFSLKYTVSFLKEYRTKRKQSFYRERKTSLSLPWRIPLKPKRGAIGCHQISQSQFWFECQVCQYPTWLSTPLHHLVMPNSCSLNHYLLANKQLSMMKEPNDTS